MGMYSYYIADSLGKCFLFPDFKILNGFIDNFSI